MPGSTERDLWRLRPWSTWTLLAILAVSLGGRTLIAYHYDGFTIGDDVEVIEATFRYGIGLAYPPWEIRNLTLPLLIAPLLLVFDALRVNDPAALVALSVLPFLLAGTLSIGLVFRLARQWSSDARVPILASLIYACHWLCLVYGSAPFPRVFSTSAVVGAAVLVSSGMSIRLRDASSRRHLLLAGSLVGFAFACRFSEALFLFPILLLPFMVRCAREAVRDASIILAGFVASSCLFVGVVDWLTWGSPFASLVTFFKFTLLEARSSSIVGSQPSWWYLKRLFHWLPVSAIPLIWVARKSGVAIRCWLFVAPVVLGLSLVHHKELRYLQGVWPFVAILAAAGTAELMRRQRTVVASVLLLLTLVLGGSRTTMVQKRSMAAVDAARHLADMEPGIVALSQAWAYGDRIYLASWDVVELPLRPAPSDLQRLPSAVNVIGIYEESLTQTPELRGVLRELGFTRTADFRRSRSEPVVLFERLTPGGRNVSEA